MLKFSIRIKDRQTGKVTVVPVEAKNIQEARAIAIQRFVVSHEVLS